MPVVSKAQGQFLGINHPDILRKWKAEGASTKTKGLPERVGKKTGPLSQLFGKK